MATKKGHHKRVSSLSVKRPPQIELPLIEEVEVSQETTHFHQKTFDFNETEAYQLDVNTKFMTTHLAKAAAIPFVQILSESLMDVISLYFIGSYSQDIQTFNSAASAITIFNIATYLIIISMNLGFSHLCQEAFIQHKKIRVGQILHKVLAIHLILHFALYLLLSGSSSFFQSLGFSPELSQAIQHFYARSPFTIIGLVIFDTLKTFLYSQGVHQPQVILQSCVLFLHLIFASHFVLTKGFGFNGIVYSLNISYFSGAVFIVLYIHFMRPIEQTTWQPVTKKSFEGIMDAIDKIAEVGYTNFVQLLIPRLYVILSLFAGPFSFGLMALLVAHKDILFSFSHAVAVVYSETMWKAILSQNKVRLQNLYKAVAGLLLIALAVQLIIFLPLLPHTIKLFFAEAQLFELARGLRIEFGLWILLESAKVVLQASFRTCNNSDLLLQLVQISQYLIGLSLTLLFGFNDYDTPQGLIIGMSVGIIVFIISSVQSIQDRALLEDAFSYGIRVQNIAAVPPSSQIGAH